ncbi:hypothetical protein MUU72_20555 [Streptomyces sp. RS10V-4]|uniref:hypothetical protein n=1 Tax=Streptomyces rhizoryzae TaxID=2932493 RepID=UPI002003520A|nr:hypothetical protein [Streptomyces rhizoryzae]MCK7625460.1 hypothetical protein [Streptomyces rhizoryzae]
MGAGAVAGGGGAAARRGRIGAAARRARTALVLFAALRAAGAVCAAGWAWRTGRHARTLLGTSWDSAWYLSIARHGYGAALPPGRWPGVPLADLAFFPLYPWLVRAVAAVVPVGAVNAGLAVAWAAALAAAWGIFAVGERLHGRRTGIWLVVLWAVLPHAVIESLAYTEALLTALAAWSLYALLTRRFVWAGALAAAAGLARPSGLAVALAVVAGAAVQAWRQRGTGRGGGRGGGAWAGRAGRAARAGQPARAAPGGRVPGVRLAVGAVLAPAGWAGYVLWAGARSGGGPLGYFAVQERWGSRFDFGRDALHEVRHLVLAGAPPAYLMAAAVVAVALLLYALLVLDRPPAALLVLTTALVVLALGGTHYFPSKPRFLLPAFPLLLPAALALARARTRTAALVAGGLAAFSFGYGAYLLTLAAVPL